MTNKTIRQIDFPVGAFPPGFHETIGKFHTLWLMGDPTIDYSIGYFLKTETSDTHMLVSGMMFGTKLRLLADLLKRSNHPQKNVLLEAIQVMQASKRDQITHAYIKSSATNITFMYRSKGGSYHAGELGFHIDDFTNHVAAVAEAIQRYQKALGAPDDAIFAFANAIRRD